MHIGLDITSLLYQRGVSRYTSNLVRALASQPKVTLSLFGYAVKRRNWLRDQAVQLLDDASPNSVVIKPYPVRAMEFLWKHNFHQLTEDLPGIDLFHSWDWIQPPVEDFPLVSTVHDLALFKFPELDHASIRSHHEESIKKLAAQQTHLIAVSQTTKKDLVEIFGYAPYLVHVIPEALPLEVSQINEQLTEEQYQKIVDDLNLKKPFILFVGTREPRKNLIRLIEAWQQLAKDIDLIIAGDLGWDKTSTDAKKYALPGLRFLGRVSDLQLSVLYAEAQLFAYVSLYEGFGLPILEAFHHGTPVVTSNTSGMREVAGNAAELVDPTSVDEIFTGINKVLNEDMQHQRQRLQRMIIRQQMFNWDSVAQQTIAVYRQAIEDFNDR